MIKLFDTVFCNAKYINVFAVIFVNRQKCDLISSKV